MGSPSFTPLRKKIMLARHVDLVFITLTLGVLRGVLASFLFH